MKRGLVSIVIPTKNSGIFLENTLRSIKNQSYRQIETIIVDGKSTDNTVPLAKKYRCRLLTYVPKVASGIFDAPQKRNYGVAHSRGAYVYIVDADMEMPPGLIAQAVERCELGADAVIIPEDSFGEGIWARAKNLERRCYWGDSTVEAPRFFKKSIWMKLGGLDETLGGGGDDWDMHEKLKHGGYNVMRTALVIRHNEGKLSLSSLMRKRFMYGRDSVRYLKKRPGAGFISYFPIRLAYVRHWYLFFLRPLDAVLFLIMRTAEYGAGLVGILYWWVRRV